ncbi:hypothetical protein ACIQXF_02480 [Lysinibacillus sp. NPDC097231]|uniref:hypothetical protein n=1 Tax=Lysinibacillus sp. NPDC097231 TaxID=3364142 RepID=UPI00381CE23A
MSLETNITNAFAVIHQTYENVQKLMSFVREISEEHGYECKIDRFLRYKSDVHVDGYYIHDFIVLFQSTDDSILETGWRDGPIYSLEIELFNPTKRDKPMLYASKYTYADIASWTSGSASGNHYVFYTPGRNDHFDTVEENDDVYKITPINEEHADKYYLGLREVRYIGTPLVDITADNIPTILFGGFDKL